ncbi:hypothetical protein ACFQES_01860 [Nonomuraea salmonea]|uniref:hypothetical protein n=1 Tax=Nonomuraea salmonea TaxID=46181 RepID=UPI003606CC19
MEPCRRTGPSQFAIAYALPRVVSATALPSGARVALSRNSAASTNLRLRCVLELASRTSSRRARSPGSSRYRSAPAW